MHAPRIACLLLWSFLLPSAPLLAQQMAAPPDAALNWGGLFRKPEPQIVSHAPHPAVARIIVRERDGIAFGSGTLIDVEGDQGLVITNWHVVRDAAGEIEVTFPDGYRSAAKVLKTDRDWDLAALVIWKPRVAPVQLAPQPAQLGEPLTIAGYGSGQFRAVSARCTQYVSPGKQLPYEMVEVSAEARQGDSGGPILNQRGEMAGVLFGAGGGTTSGSYVGRVRWFVASISPRLSDPSTTVPYSNIASTNPFVLPGGALPASTVALTEASLTPVTPVAKPPADNWRAAARQPQPGATAPSNTTADNLTDPPLQAIASTRPAAPRASQVTFGSLPDRVAAETPVAAAPSQEQINEDAVTITTEPTMPLFSRPLPKPQHSPGELLSQRPPTPPSAVPVTPAPQGAELWRQLLGRNLLEQSKSLLAVVGVVFVLTRFLRTAPAPAE